MPQKKNPDSLELIRGKAGRMFGHVSNQNFMPTSIMGGLHKISFGRMIFAQINLF